MAASVARWHGKPSVGCCCKSRNQGIAIGHGEFGLALRTDPFVEIDASAEARDGALSFVDADVPGEVVDAVAAGDDPGEVVADGSGVAGDGSGEVVADGSGVAGDESDFAGDESDFAAEHKFAAAADDGDAAVDFADAAAVAVVDFAAVDPS